MSRPRGTTEAAVIAAAARIGGQWRDLAFTRMRVLTGKAAPQAFDIAIALDVTERQARRIREALGFGMLHARRQKCSRCGRGDHNVRSCAERRVA